MAYGMLPFSELGDRPHDTNALAELCVVFELEANLENLFSILIWGHDAGGALIALEFLVE